MAPPVVDRLSHYFKHARCCPPPAQVTGVSAQPGGGSGEITITWDPLPAGEHAVTYRVYQRKGTGTYWLVAVVTDDALGSLVAGKLGIVDAPDYWPWPSGWAPQGQRCYRVTAVSSHGLEGPMSAEVCGSPP